MQQRVLVTGASKGIGKAIALKLAKDGFSIGVHYHSDLVGAQDCIQQIEQYGVKTSLLQFDTANREQCLAALEQDIEQNGAFYGIILNAGIARDAAFPALSADDWDNVIRTDLDGFYNVIQPCVMPMIGLRAGGRIISMASVSGLMGNRGQVNYSAAKAGLIGATKALAVELAKRKITVNCVAPGLIQTTMLDMHEVALQEALRSIPMQRMGQADEVAALVAFLMSPQAAYITRQVISINGGML